MTPEPFESPPAQDKPKRTKRRSALCDSIVARNPALADKTDEQLVTASCRALFLRNRTAIREWEQARPQQRAVMAVEKLDALRNNTLRQIRIDLMQLGMTIERADEVGAAIVAGELEYMAILQTLNDRLFA